MGGEGQRGSADCRECRSIDWEDVREAARLLNKVYVSEGMYGPLDRLGNARSREAVLVALYEALRGINVSQLSKEDKRLYEKLAKVADAIVANVMCDNCFELGVRQANSLAVKALSGG